MFISFISTIKVIIWLTQLNDVQYLCIYSEKKFESKCFNTLIKIFLVNHSIFNLRILIQQTRWWARHRWRWGWRFEAFVNRDIRSPRRSQTGLAYWGHYWQLVETKFWTSSVSLCSIPHNQTKGTQKIVFGTTWRERYHQLFLDEFDSIVINFKFFPKNFYYLFIH